MDTESEEEAQEIEEDDHTFDGHNYTEEYNVSSNIVEVAEASPIGKRHFGEEDSKNKRLCTEIEDEYDAIGINVAAKLRYLPANMRILAEKLINDVLFQAQINGLNSSTVIITPDPFKQDNNL